MKYILHFLLCFPMYSIAQPNCNALIQFGDTAMYKACTLVNEEINQHHQFSAGYQEVLDRSLEICPYYAYSYREKAAPYVKAGNFLVWKKLIDQAVKYSPEDYLSVRASLRYKFFADYEGAIQDIERFQKLVGEVGYTSNGTYHLNIVKGLCYKGLGNIDQAIATIETQINSADYQTGLYDFLHLGVLHLEKGDAEVASQWFEKQLQENELAETYYYFSQAQRELGHTDKAISLLTKSEELYGAGRKMHDIYNELFDQIYVSDIEKEKKTQLSHIDHETKAISQR